LTFKQLIPYYLFMVENRPPAPVDFLNKELYPAIGKKKEENDVQ